MPLDKLVLVCDNCCCCNYTYAYVLQKKHMCEQMLIWARAKTCVSTKVIKWTDKIVELMNFVKIVIFRRATDRYEKQGFAIDFICKNHMENAYHKYIIMSFFFCFIKSSHGCWPYIYFETNRFRTPYLHTYNTILTWYWLWQIKTNKNTHIPTIFLLKNKFC